MRLLRTSIPRRFEEEASERQSPSAALVTHLPVRTGPWAMEGGTGHVLLIMGVSMGIVFFALALVKRHIERNSATAPAGH